MPVVVLMSNDRWGRRCMLQLQEDENWSKPTTTTWAAEFLLKEFLGSWIRSSAVHKAKKRRAKQVITCSFPVCRNETIAILSHGTTVRLTTTGMKQEQNWFYFR